MEDLVTIHVTDLSGEEHQISAPTDMNLNVMEAIRANEIPIKATCGGMAMCASCQCYIVSSHTLPEKTDEEDAMLSEAFNVNTNSRLGCQIHINSNNLDGLEVVIAPEE